MKGTELCQVAYPSQQDRRVHEGGLEQPKRTYYAEEDQLQNDRMGLDELRQPPNRVFDHDERFVSQNDDNLYAKSEAQSRRRPEMVLPSIERDFPDEHNDQASLHGKIRQVNHFGSYQPSSRGMQQLPAPSVVNLDDYEKLPSSKRRRIDNQQPVSSYGPARTVLVPIEHVDDRRPRYERSYEAVYRDDMGHFISDKRIVPLPPKEDRTRSPISYQEPQMFSPRRQIKRRLDQVADPVERFPRPRDHYQIPLSRSENVEDLQFPSRAIFAPKEYSNDSPSFLESPQLASRHLESSDLGFPSRHDVGVIANSDRAYAASDGMTRRLHPLEVAEKSMPSRLSDLSIDGRQREGDRIIHLPFTAASDFHRHTKPSTGAFTYSIKSLRLMATAMLYTQ